MHRLPLTLVLLTRFAAGVASAEVADTVALPAAAPSLTIRTYSMRPSDEPSDSTRALAAALLADAGIRARWLSCVAGHAEAACTDEMTPTDLAMRIVRDRETVSVEGPQEMGRSLIDTAQGVGTLATLHLNRVEDLAHSSEASLDVVFARALAHEAAHLVLGTADHGTRGIMRPLWSRDMLRLEHDAEWTFTAEEGRRMREALVRRGQMRPPAHGW